MASRRILCKSPAECQIRVNRLFRNIEKQMRYAVDDITNECQIGVFNRIIDKGAFGRTTLFSGIAKTGIMKSGIRGVISKAPHTKYLEEGISPREVYTYNKPDLIAWCELKLGKVPFSLTIAKPGSNISSKTPLAMMKHGWIHGSNKGLFIIEKRLTFANYSA